MADLRTGILGLAYAGEEKIVTCSGDKALTNPREPFRVDTAPAPKRASRGEVLLLFRTVCCTRLVDQMWVCVVLGSHPFGPNGFRSIFLLPRGL